MATKKSTSKSKTPAAKKPTAKKAAPKKAAARTGAKPAKAKRAKSKLQTPAAPPAGPAPDTSPPFQTQDPTAAYDHFRTQVSATPQDDLKHLNVDPDIVINNVDLAMNAWSTIQAAAVAAIPTCPVNRYLELPSLALALLYASDQVIGQASTGEIASRLTAVRALRAPMLETLGVLASPPVAIADPARVKAIRAGTGALDTAHDAVNIAGYFAELGSKITGKHPFTAAQLDALAEGGQWLLQQLQPTAAVSAPSPSDPAAVLRDQLWTVLSARYDGLRAAAAVVVGFANVDQTIPPLGTRIAKAKAAAAQPAAAGAAAAAAPAAAPAAAATAAAVK